VMIPLITVIGLEIGGLVAGSIITETVFAWPGIGKLLIDSINMLDRPVVVAYMTIFTFLFVIINLIVDILYIVIDPRTRDGLQG
jgi:peptide/nickel transport system permease protein